MLEQLTKFQFLQQGGFVLLILAVCSLASIAVIIERMSAFSFVLGKKKKYSKALEALITKRKSADAINYFNSKPSMIGDLYLSILNNKKKSRPDIEEAAQCQILKILVVLERNLNVLATLGSTTPFIGLFGTVFGIIKTFRGMSFAQTYSTSVVTSGIA